MRSTGLNSHLHKGAHRGNLGHLRPMPSGKMLHSIYMFPLKKEKPLPQTSMPQWVIHVPNRGLSSPYGQKTRTRCFSRIYLTTSTLPSHLSLPTPIPDTPHQKKHHHAQMEELWSGKHDSPLSRERWTKTCCGGTNIVSQKTALCGTSSRDGCGSMTGNAPPWPTSAHGSGNRPWRKWWRWATLRRCWPGTESSARGFAQHLDQVRKG